MTKSELNSHQLLRFKRAPVCPICYCYIEDWEQFDILRARRGKSVPSIFIHQECIDKFLSYIHSS